MSEVRVTGFSWYAGMETGDAWVVICSCLEAGRKKTVG